MSISKFQNFSNSIQTRMEEPVEKQQPDKMIRNLQYVKNLKFRYLFINVVKISTIKLFALLYLHTDLVNVY